MWFLPFVITWAAILATIFWFAFKESQTLYKWRRYKEDLINLRLGILFREREKSRTVNITRNIMPIGPENPFPSSKTMDRPIEAGGGPSPFFITLTGEDQILPRDIEHEHFWHYFSPRSCYYDPDCKICCPAPEEDPS